MRPLHAACALLLLAAAPSATAAVDAFAVEGGWVRTPPPGAPTAVAHLVLVNRGRLPQMLEGIDSPGFTRVQLHRMDMAGGVMRMRPVAGPLALPAGGRLDLGGEGLHVMLIGPKQPVAAGGRVELVLRFAQGGRRRVSLPVRAVPPGADGR